MQKIYFYITTPLYRVNDGPHLGHAYAALAADILARHKRARQVPVFFQSGASEHGADIEKLAKEHGVTPKAWCDSVSGEFKRLWKLLGISCDHFIRTTDAAHETAVRTAFEKLIKTGDIYPGGTEGLYCRSCESFYEESELRDGNCPEHATPAEKIGEEIYFFRLSKYKKALLAHYAAEPLFLAPGRGTREAADFVGAGLKDLPVSRSKTAWGIKAPPNRAHTICSWFDTLMSYATGPGYDPDDPSDGFQMKWPADVHLAGKEDFRSHAVVWPAVLMALGLELPKKIYTHGKWTFDGGKTSGSEGGAAALENIAREYGSDALRYFLFREPPFGRNGDFTLEALKRRYNSELAGDLEGLFSRVLGMVQQYLSNRLPDRPETAELFEKISARGPEIDGMINALRFSSALDEIRRAVELLNKAIDRKKPRELADAEPEELKLFLHDLVWCLRAIAGWIYPFMPDTATRMQLGLAVAKTASGGFDIQKPHTLFPRKE